MLKAILRFYKNWALPISMVMGVVLYFVYTSLPFLKGTSHAVNQLIGILQPALIFGMLAPVGHAMHLPFGCGSDIAQVETCND